MSPPGNQDKISRMVSCHYWKEGSVKKEGERGAFQFYLSIGKCIKAQHHPPAPSSSEDGEKQKLQGSPLPLLKDRVCQKPP